MTGGYHIDQHKSRQTLIQQVRKYIITNCEIILEEIKMKDKVKQGYFANLECEGQKSQLRSQK